MGVRHIRGNIREKNHSCVLNVIKRSRKRGIYKRIKVCIRGVNRMYV